MLKRRHTNLATFPAVMSVIMGTALINRPAQADILFNATLRNPYPEYVNDYHVTLKADQNFSIAGTFQNGGDVSFNPGQVNGSNSTWSIDWSGATVNPGQTTHVGAGTGLGGGTPNGLKITESWWTVNGAKVSEDTIILRAPRIPSIKMNGVAGAGNWVVAKIELFNSMSDPTPSGTVWFEGRGSDVLLTNETSGLPIFARWALNTPGPSEIPIENLNATLGGFGPFGPVVPLEPVLGVFEPQSPVLPVTSELWQNFPNPFNASTTIRFNLRTAGRVQLEIFNILGERVSLHSEADLPPGSYSYDWDATDDQGRDLPTGVYLYRLTAPNFIQTRKMTLLK